MWVHYAVAMSIFLYEHSQIKFINSGWRKINLCNINWHELLMLVNFQNVTNVIKNFDTSDSPSLNSTFDRGFTVGLTDAGNA